jgi:hypothetical protein
MKLPDVRCECATPVPMMTGKTHCGRCGFQLARGSQREIIARVLSENESRCLDDADDREVVLRELVKALS